MKKPLLFLLATIAFSNLIKAQTPVTIPNRDFETWDSTSFNDLNAPWTTENIDNVASYGIAPVTKVTGQSGSAVHLQTYKIGKDTIEGTVAIQGAPYSQMPSGLGGYYKCHSLGHDTAYILVEFTLGGNIIAGEEFPFTTSDTTKFTAFNFNFMDPLSITPDSVFIGATSSNLINYVGIMPGSWLELDQLAFTGSNITQPIPGGGFENWSLNTLNVPAGWQPAPIFYPQTDIGVSRSADHYSGNYSVKMVAQPTNSPAAQLTSGIYDQYGNISGGQPYQKTSDTLMGYYKFIPSGLDSGGVLVYLQNQGSVVFYTGLTLAPASVWTPFQMPISSPSTPDTMRIDLFSSTYNAVNGGSILYIDDLQLKSQPHTAGISFNSKPGFGISAFPDPAQNQLNLRFNGSVPSEFSLKIYNSEGRVMVDNEFNSGLATVTIPIDQLSAGLYFYEITTNGSTVRNKFVKSN